MKSALLFNNPLTTKNIIRAGYKSLGVMLAIAATMAGEFAIIFLIHKLP